MFFKCKDPLWENDSQPSQTESKPEDEFHVSSKPPSWPTWLVWLYISFIVIVILAAMLFSVRAGHAQRPPLDTFTPVIYKIIEWNESLLQNIDRKVAWTGAISALILLLIGAIGTLSKSRKGLRPFFFLTALSLAILAQTCYFLDRLLWGHILYGTTFALLLVWRFLPQSMGPRLDAPEEEPENKTSRKWFSLLYLEAASLAFITLLVVLFRFYALNQIPHMFDGEMVASMAVATDLQSAFELNHNYINPLGWAPLGLIYFLLVNFFVKACGTTLLAIRIISAVVGIVLVQLVYLLLRRMAGRTAAILGMLFFAFSPLEIVWGRFDFFPLSYPTLITAALAVTTYLALEKEKWIYFFLTALFMGLTYHVFPSGQTGFLIPLGVMAWNAIFGTNFWKRCGLKIPLILAGVALWLMGLTFTGYLATGEWKWMNPLSTEAVSRGTLRGHTVWTMSDPNASFMDKLPFMIDKVWDNISGFVKSLYVAIEWPHYRYSPVPNIPEHDGLYIPAMVSLLLFVGAVIFLLTPRRRHSSFMWMWLIAALLPGFLSSQAEARRVATVFPAFSTIAAWTAILAFRQIRYLTCIWLDYAFRILVIVCVFFSLVIIHGGLYFQQPRSIPPSSQVTDRIKDYVKPNSLVIANFAMDDPYRLVNEIVFTLIDELNRPDNPSIFYIPKPERWPEVAVNPQPNFQRWYYKYTMLKGQIDHHQRNPEWKQLTYLLHDIPANKSKLKILRGIYPEAKTTYHQIHHQYNFYALETHFDSQSIKTQLQPQVTVQGQANQLAKSPDQWWEGVQVQINNVPSAATQTYVTARGGLWLPELRWVSFRIQGGGSNTQLNINGRLVKTDQYFPMMEGVNHLKMDFPQPENFPFRLMSREYPQRLYRPVESDLVVSPKLSEVEPLKPKPFEFYPGYRSFKNFMHTPPEMESDFDVSSQGVIALLGRFSNHWKVQIRAPNSRVISEWEHPIINRHHEIRYGICFYGSNSIAILDSPMIFFYDFQGNLLREYKLPIANNAAVDIDGNERGDVFVGVADQQCIYHFRLDQEEPVRFRPNIPKNKRWVPRKLSASAYGPLAVLDEDITIQFFEPRGTEFHWSRELKVEFNLGTPQFDPIKPLYFQVDSDGWYYSCFLFEKEIRVVDPRGVRRIANSPNRDLSTMLRERCHRIIGFDKVNHLYVWNQRNHAILQLTPMNASQ